MQRSALRSPFAEWAHAWYTPSGRAAVQELEKELQEAAEEVQDLLREKQGLAQAADALQCDLDAERKLNEEMQDILETFRIDAAGT
jgi:uncharacterized protein YlxW (UPF0749 family)